VSQTQNPLRINVGFLLNQQVGVNRDIHFDYPEYFVRPDLDLANFTGLLRISRTNTGLLAQGEFSGGIQMQCVRCLVDYRQTLIINFDELFSFKGKPVSEYGLVVPDDAYIDFTPLVWEFFTLEVPISPLCKPECKGLCPECGEDLNSTTCAHVVNQA
jgi:uncharacterized protein